MTSFGGKLTVLPRPNHLIVDPYDKDKPGPWSTFTVGELRLYPVLYMAYNDKGHVANLTNEYLRDFSGLNRTSLPKAIESLKKRDLIRVTQVGKSREEHRYEILDQAGKPMTNTAGPMPTNKTTSISASASTDPPTRHGRRFASAF